MSEEKSLYQQRVDAGWDPLLAVDPVVLDGKGNVVREGLCGNRAEPLLTDRAKDAAEKAGKNAGVAPELLYADILWAMQDLSKAFERRWERAWQKEHSEGERLCNENRQLRDAIHDCRERRRAAVDAMRAAGISYQDEVIF